MASLNKVFIIGNLTKDPELRRTPAGMAVVDLRLAANRKFKSAAGGDEREETCYVNVTVWGRQAETTGEYLKKGSPVLIEGRLKYDEWEKEGQKHSRVSIVAERVQFMGGPKPRSAAEDFGAGSQTAPAPAADAPGPVEEPRGAADDDDLPF